MTAAQPAPEPAAPPGQPQADADIIDLTTRRSRSHAVPPHASRRFTAMPDHDDTQLPATAEERAMYEDLADQLEQRFRNIRETLTDPRTAHVFKASLTVVEGLLEGVRAQDIIDAGQYELLTAMMGDLRTAADHV
ncbi:hypothetical protein [Streptomyces chilikensis]|uniref:Uncharacterized protein n=1 Tax=Streptomyces chilikensis TaxID=1194079 RepID=A0ABV3ERH6_9ACTN